MNSAIQSLDTSSSISERSISLTTLADGIQIGTLDSHTLEMIGHDVDRALTATKENASESRFTYVYVDGEMCFLTADTSVCSPGSCAQVQTLLQRSLARPGERRIVSSPQLKIFVNGSFRCWGRDDVPRGLHYLLIADSGNTSGTVASTMQIVLSGQQATSTGSGSVSVELVPGRLVVHDTALQYRVHSKIESANPGLGLIVLDGYVW